MTYPRLDAAQFALSALWGEREGTRLVSDGESEVGRAAFRTLAFPHLTATLSAPEGGEGDKPGFDGIAREARCRSKS